MDECPSWGYNKTRKQQLCDCEYSFSPSCSQLVSTIALIAYHSQADQSAGMTTAQRAAVLRNHRQHSSAMSHAQSVCLCSGRSAVTVEQRAAQPDLHRDGRTGRVSKPSCSWGSVTAARARPKSCGVALDAARVQSVQTLLTPRHNWPQKSEGYSLFVLVSMNWSWPRCYDPICITTLSRVSVGCGLWCCFGD